MAELCPIVGILAGPTASGKSGLAVETAKAHDLAIISADSMQVYRGMEIGTGIIPVTERRGVPHSLLNIADPREDFNAAKFVESANAAAQSEWSENGRRSLVVGGTGMWVQALREGLLPGPGRDERIRQRLREEMNARGAAALHEQLRMIDKVSADRLAPADHVRVVRALEVFELTGKTLSQWQREDKERRSALGKLIPLVVLNPPREEIAARIVTRVDGMLAAGWLEEARSLHAMNLPEHSPARKALGYRELFRVINGEISVVQARDLIVIATRQYARRQRVWFQPQREVQWLWPPSVAELETIFAL